MLKKTFTSVYRWSLRFITLQLFVTLMSLPLLVAWGLPLSLLSPLGNSIFNPLLTVFLIISTLMFITELVFIPNGFLCWLLDLTTRLFVATSSYADSSWLVGIRHLPLPLLFGLPVLALWIIITPLLHKPWARAGTLALVLVVVWAGARLTDTPQLEVLRPGRGQAAVALAYDTHTVAVFDYGTMNPSYRYRTWWEYTLMPQLTKTTGRTSIDYLVCLKPSLKTLESLATIHTLSPVKHLVLIDPGSQSPEWTTKKTETVNTLGQRGIDCVTLPAVSKSYALSNAIRYTITQRTSPRAHITEVTARITCAGRFYSLGAKAH
jgi:hypothetical protein